MKFLTVVLISLSCLNAACINIAGECRNTSKKEVRSPDGKLKVVVYNHGCGATTGFMTGISIIPVDHPLKDSDEANVLLAGNLAQKFSRDNSNTLIEGEMNFDAKWDGNTNLTVYYSELRVIEKHEQYDGVTIRFASMSETKQ